jgi:hypothetical protein
MFIASMKWLQDAPGYWYLATPYGKRADREEAWKQALRLRGLLLKRGITCYCPVAECHPVAIEADIDPLDSALWAEDLEPKLKAAYGVIVGQLDGVEKSDGIRDEIKKALAWGKPVLTVDPEDLDPFFYS